MLDFNFICVNNIEKDNRYSFYCPGPDNDFSMNFFLVKHIHHLLGLPSSVENTFSQTLLPVS